MTNDLDRNPGSEEKARPEAVEIRSKYEFVMAASKEAERLNELLRRRGMFSPRDKVTMEAVKRIRRGYSRVVYEDQPTATEDPGKESTYFFGG